MAFLLPAGLPQRRKPSRIFSSASAGVRPSVSSLSSCSPAMRPMAASCMRASCSNFGILVDLSHFPITYEKSRFVVQTLRPYITHLHFGNAVVKAGCPAYGDKHPRLGFPNGSNDT